VGETALGLTYHYHATEEFPNLPPCLVGVQAQDNFSTTAKAGVGAPRAGGDGQMPPEFEEAAQKLGVTLEELQQAFGDVRGGAPDLTAAAKALGIEEAELRAVLPPPPNR
jgi:hypothetical protein